MGAGDGVSVGGMNMAVRVEAAAAVWATIVLTTPGIEVGIRADSAPLNNEHAVRKINDTQKYFFIASSLYPTVCMSLGVLRPHSGDTR